jgi:hypothetical protein
MDLVFELGLGWFWLKRERLCRNPRRELSLWFMASFNNMVNIMVFGQKPNNARK